MSGEASTTSQTILDDATRQFVRGAISAGLVELDDVKKVVASLLTDSDRFTPKRISDGLVGAGLLTEWQAHKLLAGKTKGFYLGSYKLLRPIGKGGMGVVYLGEHHVMKRLMALKILPAEALKDQRRIQRFQEEARASAQLDHQNIVRAYDFAEAGGKIYIVMEYVDGTDLHHAVARDGVMPINAAVDAIRQACAGLSHAHERGIIHRDIKPSNLMLRSDGVVKVSDMGLARIGWTVADDASSGHRLTGTADFVAPEQAIDSKTVDARADIYSLGCTLFFLLTGRAPYSGNSISQRLAKHQTAPVPDVRTRRPDCPAALAELVKRMMAKRPAERPASASELTTQLLRVHGGGKEAQDGHLSRIAAVSDTSVDDSFYQATIDDTSLSSDGEVAAAETFDEFDFSTLPSVDMTKVTQRRATGSAGTFPANPYRTSPPAATKSAKKRSAGQGGNGDKQQLLLGVGLALAVLALVAVVGVTAYTLTRSPETGPPKIKSVEDGKGGQVIVVGE